MHIYVTCVSFGKCGSPNVLFHFDSYFVESCIYLFVSREMKRLKACKYFNIVTLKMGTINILREVFHLGRPQIGINFGRIAKSGYSKNQG